MRILVFSLFLILVAFNYQNALAQFSSKDSVKYNKANHLYKTENYRQAADLFNQYSLEAIRENKMLNAARFKMSQAVSFFKLQELHQSISIAELAESYWRKFESHHGELQYAEHLIALDFFQDLSFVYLQLGQKLHSVEDYLLLALKSCHAVDCLPTKQIELNQNLATTYYYQRKIIDAEAAYEKVLSLTKNNPKVAMDYYSAALFGLVSTKNELGKFLDSEKLYYSIDSIYESKNPYISNWILGSKASHYLYQGLYKESIRHANEAILLNKKIGGKELEQVAYRHTKSEAFSKLSVNDSAISGFIKNLQTERKLLGENHPNLAYSYNGLGEIYSKTLNDSAAFYYKKSLLLTELSTSDSSYEYSSILDQYGSFEIKKGRYNQGIEYLKKADSLIVKLQGKHSPRRLETLFKLAEAYYEAGETSMASTLNRELLNLNLINPSSLSYRHKYRSPVVQLSALRFEMFLRLKLEARTDVKLEAINKVYYEIEKFMESVINDPFALDDRLELWKEFKQAFEMYLEVNHSNPDTFYQLLSSAELLKYKPITDKIYFKKNIEIGTDLFDTLQRIENRISQLKLESSHSEEVSNEYKRELFKLESKYDQMYRNYAVPISLEEITKSLKRQIKKKTVISYFKSNSDLFIFGSHNGENSIVKRPLRSIDNQINSFRESTQITTEKSIEIIKANGLFLYENLFPFDWVHKQNQITISTSAPLNNFAFDALLTDEASSLVQFKDFPFLLYKHELSFTPSLIMSNKSMDSPYSKDLSIWSIEPNKNIENVPLNAVLKEVRNIKSLFDSVRISSNKPKGKQLKSDFENSKILHFATHAFIDLNNPEFSYLMLSSGNNDLANNRLYLFEIFDQKSNAELAFLAACATGVVANQSDLQFGNSLAIGFLASGVQNVISTLWESNDYTSAEISSNFYTQLQNNSISSSLRKSKIEHIQNSPNIVAHPFYWAQFRQYQLIDLGTEKANLSWLLLVCLILVFVIFLKNKK